MGTVYNNADGGGCMLSKETKEHIWFLYKSEQLSKTEIARRIGISRGSVYNVLNEPMPVNEQIVNDVKKAREESNKKLLDLLRNDDRMTGVSNKILNAINDTDIIDNMKVTPQGLKSLMTVFGIVNDKHIAAKRITLEERRVRATERLADLKEKELEMRMVNPDVFQDVVIIDDAKEAYNHYKEKDMPTDGSTS